MLLAEAGGTPSPAPVQLGSPAALPNQTCPAWAHNRHQIVENGVCYFTWHRQIDPVYWCHYRHEHGSNPARFGNGQWKPLFGRTAIASGIAENHEGFKAALFEHPNDPQPPVLAPPCTSGR